MRDPNEQTQREQHDSKEPYPDVRGAFILTLVAMFAAAFTGVAFIDFGLLAAVGIGQAIGVGAVATIGAQRVRQPQAERLGLRALDWQTVPMILCLAPAVLIASELDNFATDWTAADTSSERLVVASGSPSEFQFDDRAEDVDPVVGGDEIGTEASERETSGSRDDEGALADEQGSPASGTDLEAFPLIDPNNLWSLLQAIVVMVGISPVVEEFLFRGVIQQGLVERMGLLRGVTTVALLWTLLRPAPLTGFVRFVTAAVASFALGWALGIVRIATGSILGSVLLSSVWAAIGLASLSFEGRLDLPGMNVEGSHLPWSITLASLVLVAWAGRALYEEAKRRDVEDRASGRANVSTR